MLLGFGASSIDIQFSVWANSSKYLEVKTGLLREVKAAFDKNPEQYLKEVES